MICGIYRITNKINGHMYIGLSKNIEQRIKDHFSHGINGHRKDDLNKALYQAFKKYGLENFEWDVLEECSENQLKDREIYWIKYYNTYENREHYNETPGGDYPGYNTVHLGENHGMAKLTTEDVVFCRQEYMKGNRSRDIYDRYFKDKIKYSGFEGMWHGYTWKHIMPEVFKNNPHRATYGEQDRDKIIQLFKKSGLSMSAFSKTKECFVGYGTLHNMINNPSFYDGK